MYTNILKPYNMRKIIRFSALFFFVVAFVSSCKKPEDQVGLLLQPDNLDINVNDTTRLIMYTVKDDSLRTDETVSNTLLGSYVDPVFGKVQAGIYTQIRLEAPVDFEPQGGTLNDLTVDSMVLYLVLNGHYGHLDAQTFSVFQLAENIYRDSSYYNNSTVNTLPTDLVLSGTGTIVPNTQQNGVVGKDTINKPVLKIKLDPSLGESVINQSGTGVLSANDGAGKFVEWFKGLYITVDNPTQQKDKGCILYPDLLNVNSKVVMYYRNTVLEDTVRYNFLINANCARFHSVTHDYNSTAVQAQFTDSTLGQNLSYIQAMGGCVTRVNIPNLKRYGDQGKVAVNRAELVLPFQFFAISRYLAPTRLLLFAVDETGKLLTIADNFTPGGALSNAIGGNADWAVRNYSFNITRHVNEVLRGKTENYTLVLVAAGSAVSANRVVLNGPQTTKKEKPKLKITFTEY